MNEIKCFGKVNFEIVSSLLYVPNFLNSSFLSIFKYSYLLIIDRWVARMPKFLYSCFQKLTTSMASSVQHFSLKWVACKYHCDLSSIHYSSIFDICVRCFWLTKNKLIHWKYCKALDVTISRSLWWRIADALHRTMKKRFPRTKEECRRRG